MSEFSHLKNKLLAEQVEDQIYHYILDEALEPGAKLPNEFALGEKFRVGRSTPSAKRSSCCPARASWRCGRAPAPMW